MATVHKIDSNLHGHPAELLVVGGAALAVHWMQLGSYDRVTFDVDIVPVLTPPERVTFAVDTLTIPLPHHLQQAARAVSRREGLDARWLNNDVRDAVASIDNLEPELLFSGRNLQVYRPSLPVLLAMKLTAHREDKDLADAVELTGETGINTVDGMLSLLEKVYGPNHITADMRGFIGKTISKHLAREEQHKSTPGNDRGLSR